LRPCAFEPLNLIVMKSKLLLSALFTFVFCLLSSQIPQGFNYQAIARDGTSGNPIINASLPVTITIQSELTGGTVFWKEEHASVTTNSFGVFSLMVGKGTRQSGLDHFYDIDWTVSPKYIKTQIFYLGELKDMGTSELLSVPYSMVAGNLNGTLKKLEVKSQTDVMDEALFEVKNKGGQTVFAVYNEGVRVYVDDGIGTKGAKGGFAIGGFGTSKSDPGQDYFIVDPTQIRMYFDQTISPVKGAKGGFAIGGFGTSKGTIQNFLRINNDSTRFFINDDPLNKGAKGGFAIGGFGTSKGNTNFFNVETATSGLTIIDPSENRILFHPLKNAFLVGKVLIKNVSDVGENSFASGFESVATGDQSQSMGYKTVALGKRSTAMGSESRAEGWFSFAMGSQSVASGMNAAAIGGYCQAAGGNAMAMGWLSTASGPASFAIGNGCTASASNSQAMGWGSEASGQESTAIGNACVASGLKSFAFGDVAKALNDNSYSFGKSSQAKGKSSYAIGESVIAGSETSENCYAFGKSTHATGNGSYAFGDGAIASGTYATAFGKLAQASNTSSFAFGESASSISPNSFSLGKGAIAEGESSYAFGEGAHASNLSSYALGKGAIASGPNSYAFGAWGQDDPDWGTNPLGSNTQATGNNSFAVGRGVIASADNAISIGFCTRAAGGSCVAIGYGSRAEGNASAVAIGQYAISTGNCAVAMGFWANASGQMSTALGLSTSSVGYASTAMGNYTTATAAYSTAIGRGNLGLPNSLFEIGNGDYGWGGTGTKMNVLTVLDNGNMGLGTADPQYRLDVVSNLYGVRILGGGASNPSSLQLGRTSEDGALGVAAINGNWCTQAAAGDVVLRANSSANSLYLSSGSGNAAVKVLSSDVYFPVVPTTVGGPTNKYFLIIDGTGKISKFEVNTSSRKYKESISDIENIDWLYNLRPVNFNFRNDPSRHKEYGLIAEEVVNVNQSLVGYNEKGEVESVSYNSLIAPLIKSAQDQEQTIENLSKENQELKSQVQILQEKMEQIELLLAKKDIK
jgi:hypothetical protein